MENPEQLTLFITLFVIAFLLIGAEIYVPGGIMGTIGALCLAGAVVLGFRMSPLMGGISLAAVMLLGILGLTFWFLFFPRTPAGKRLTLSADGADFKIDLPQFASLQDHQGVTLSALRPSGVAQIDGHRHDVTAADGLWLDAGTPVRVSRVRGSRIEVAPLVSE